METIFLPIFIQYFCLILKYGLGLFSEYREKLTKKQVKTYFIPLVGIWFLMKDWYNKLPD